MKVLISFVFLLLLNCSKTDPVTGEKILIEPNPQKKSAQAAAKGDGLFGDINNKKGSSNTFEFASSNILWRATLKNLEFLPLVNADYSGGVIIYDWYSEKPNSNEQIKVSIRFLSNELRSESIKVLIHKKTCDENNKCITAILNNNLADEIKEKILFTARSIRVDESKSKN